MRTLLINLTRFGDLLQSQPLIHELAAGGHPVGLVCLDNFSGAAGLLRDVESLFPLPGSRFLAALDSDWRSALACTQTFVQDLRERFAPDCVVNLTSTSAGRLLARSLGQGLPVRGFGVDELGFGANNTLWTAFFEAASRRRGCSPFNIVDVFRKAMGCGFPPSRNTLRPPDETTLHAMTERLVAAGQGALPLVALQLGASETRRQWPVASFVQVGQALAAAGYLPVLVGSAGERPLAAAYTALAGERGGHRFADCVGGTSLQELAALLRLSSLLITNDTGTMHLAAGLDVPCIAIFLATAQPWDTGPYRADCLCLEPDLPCHPCGFGTVCPRGEICGGAVRPETVLGLGENLLLNPHGELGALPDTALYSGSRVWRTLFDAQGAADLQSLSGHEGAERTAWLRLQRHFYRQFLDSADGLGAAVSDPPDPAWADALPPATRASLAATLEQAQSLLLLVEQSGKLLLAGTPSPQSGQRFLGAVHRLVAVFEDSHAFDALGRLWLSSTQERGNDFPDVLRLAALLRRHLGLWHEALADSGPTG